MGNTFSMQASHKLGFLHHIRLVPLFSSILGGILLLFALSAGLAGYFLLQADRDRCHGRDSGTDGIIQQR